MEKILGQFLNSKYKDSEWFVGCTDQLQQFVNAVAANKSLQSERAHKMTNITAFNSASTGGAGTTVDDYLSLFRVLRNGKLYKLTSQNVQLSITKMTTNEFLAPDNEQRTHLANEK